MRNLVLLAIALATSGCHGSCGGCADFETCEPMATTCTLNSGAQFDLIAVDGQVSTDGRNFLTDGVPNPDICVDLGGGQKCTGAQIQTYYPAWHTTVFTSLDGQALLATPISISYIDRGLIHDVNICNGSVAITESYLHEGGFSFNCTNGSHARLTLKNVAKGTTPGDGGGGD